MERKKFLTILRELNKVCKQVNIEQKRKDPEDKVIYEVLQFSKLALKWCSVQDITEFYNQNWLGNVDYMHIPDFRQILENCREYPIIIAREEDKDEILGISTIKYFENKENNMDPYFPENNAKYFSITGILTRKDNPHKGIGKKIYEIALRGAHNYEEYYPDTRIMCVIDCRNNQSLKALSSAVQNISDTNAVGENKELPAYILGYYELRNKENDELLEAPTLVLEVGLEATDKMEQPNTRTIDYNKKEGQSLFDSLREDLKQKLNKYNINMPVINEDSECGMVYFYSLNDKEKCKIQGININSNGTEKGNDRKPRDSKLMYDFVGPMPGISMEEDER